MAQRCGATVVELESSHASPIAHPQTVAKLITHAVRG
jgi:hypothetical protein